MSLVYPNVHPPAYALVHWRNPFASCLAPPLRGGDLERPYGRLTALLLVVLERPYERLRAWVWGLPQRLRQATGRERRSPLGWPLFPTFYRILEVRCSFELESDAEKGLDIHFWKFRKFEIAPPPKSPKIAKNCSSWPSHKQKSIFICLVFSIYILSKVLNCLFYNIPIKWLIISFSSVLCSRCQWRGGRVGAFLPVISKLSVVSLCNKNQWPPLD